MGRTAEKLKEQCIDRLETKSIGNIYKRFIGNYKVDEDYSVKPGDETLHDIRLAYEEETLSEMQKFAIWLHLKLCKSEHSIYCSFFKEIDGLDHDWDGKAHKKYLELAKEMVKVTGSIEIAKQVVELSVKNMSFMQF